MTTFCLSARLSDPVQPGELMQRLGLLEEEDPDLAIHLSLDDDQVRALEIYHPTAGALSAVQPKINSVVGQLGASLDFSLKRIADLDWVAKVQAELCPVVSGRFILHGRHDRNRLPVGFTAIEIEAAQAFGTGHHPSTHACLAALDKLKVSFSPSRVLDFGCGSGVLGIAAFKRYRSLVEFIDIDPVAVGVTRLNARLNRVPSLGRAWVSSRPRQSNSSKRSRYDLVFANILAGPLIRLAPELSRALKPGGTLILAGIIENQAGRVESAYRLQGLTLRSRQFDGEWTCFIFERTRLKR